MTLPADKILGILADNLEKRKGVIPLSRKESTGWAEGLGIPAGGDTVLYTGQMYQIVPAINAMTSWMKKIEDLKLTGLFGAGRAINRFINLSRFMMSGNGQEQKTCNEILRNIALLLRMTGIEFGYLYEKELYSGALLFDEGIDDVFAQQARRVYKTFKNSGVKRVITVDPHTTNMLRSVYPGVIDGFDIEVTNYLELLAQHTLKPVKSVEYDVVIHDPCVYARFENIIEEPRHLLRNAGIKVYEPELSGKMTWCCGGPLESLYQEKAHAVAAQRIEQLKSCGTRIVTMCPICLAILKRTAGEGIEVKDISEYLIEAYGD